MIPMNPSDREIRQVFEAADFGPEVARKEAARLDAIGKRLDEDKKRDGVVTASRGRSGRSR